MAYTDLVLMPLTAERSGPRSRTRGRRSRPGVRQHGTGRHRPRRPERHRVRPARPARRRRSVRACRAGRGRVWSWHPFSQAAGRAPNRASRRGARALAERLGVAEGAVVGEGTSRAARAEPVCSPSSGGWRRGHTVGRPGDGTSEAARARGRTRCTRRDGRRAHRCDSARSNRARGRAFAARQSRAEPGSLVRAGR